MKKVMIIVLILLSFVFVAGCLNYKAYDTVTEEVVTEESDLLDEIAQIEAELQAEEENIKEVVEEEVVLPELNENSEPVSEDSAMDVVMVKENEQVSLKPKINDPDGDPITFTFSQPLNEQGTWKTNYGDAGEYTVSLSATDGVLTTTKNIKIVVEKVNVAPTIEDLQDLVVSEGEVVNFEPSVTDPNGDSVTVTVSEPLKSGTFATEYTSSGEYNIKVIASDGELETEKSFTLTINDVNSLPKITGLESVSVQEGETVTLQPEVTDLDNDELTVTISEPVGDDGVWETSFTDNGEYLVTVTVSDGKDIVTKNIQVMVEDINVAPEIVDIIVEKN